MLESRVFPEVYYKAYQLTLALYRVTDFFPDSEVLRRQLREKANEIFGMISEYHYLSDHHYDVSAILAKIYIIKGYIGIARSMHFVKPVNFIVIEREYTLLSHHLTRNLKSMNATPFSKNRSVHISPFPLMGNSVESNAQSTGTYETMGEDKYESALAKKAVLARNNAKNNAVTDKGEIVSDIGHDVQEAVSENSMVLNTDAPEEVSERQKTIIEYIREKRHAKISDLSSLFRDVSLKTIQRDLQHLVMRDLLRKEGEKRWTVYSLNIDT